MNRFYFPSNLAAVFKPAVFHVTGWSKSNAPILGEQVQTKRFGNIVELDLQGELPERAVLQIQLYDWTAAVYKAPLYAVVYDSVVYLLPSRAAAKELF